MNNDYIQVFTTVEKREDADRIASTVVNKRVAACAQILGSIHSIYWWKGKVEEAGEWLLMMKTRQDLFSSLEKEIRAVHPYEVPEIVALPIVAGSASYLQWIDEETEKAGSKKQAASSKNGKDQSRKHERTLRRGSLRPSPSILLRAMSSVSNGSGSMTGQAKARKKRGVSKRPSTSDKHQVKR